MGWFCSVKITPMMRLKFATASPQSALSATKDVLAATEVKSSVKFPLVQKNGTPLYRRRRGGEPDQIEYGKSLAIHPLHLQSRNMERFRVVCFLSSAILGSLPLENNRILWKFFTNTGRGGLLIFISLILVSIFQKGFKPICYVYPLSIVTWIKA